MSSSCDAQSLSNLEARNTLSSSCDANMSSSCDNKTPSNGEAGTSSNCDAKTAYNYDAPPLPETLPPSQSSFNQLSEILDVLTRKNRPNVGPSETSLLQKRPTINVTDVDDSSDNSPARQTVEVETKSELPKMEMKSENFPKLDLTDEEPQSSGDQIDDEIFAMRLAADLVSDKFGVLYFSTKFSLCHIWLHFNVITLC